MTIIKKRGKNIKFTNINIDDEIKSPSCINIKDTKLIPSYYILHLKPQKNIHLENKEDITCENLNYNVFTYDPKLTVPVPFIPTDNACFSNQYSFLSSHIEKDSQIELSDSKPDKILNSESIWCWWCCHSFQNKAYRLPLRKKNDGSLESIGNFCSPECICAYSMETGSKYGDKWEQLELLHSMLKIKKRIQRAPPREHLSVFGGSLSCDEFRDVNKSKQSYIVYPPMISLKIHIDDLEEQENSIQFVTDSSNYVDINNLNIIPFEKPKKETNKVVVKSNKKNTLDKFVDIKI
jgi:hypothetical protein